MHFAVGLGSGFDELLQPSFDVAGSSHQLVLQINLGKAFIAGTAQSVSTHQFSDTPLDSVYLLYFLLKFRAFLFAPSLLQYFVEGSYPNRAMEFFLFNASTPTCTVSALAPKLIAL